MSEKILIHTETFHKSGAPHLLATAVDANIFDRENQYQDLVGLIYQTEDGYLPDYYHDLIFNYAITFNKNMVLIYQRGRVIKGWLYFEQDDDIKYREIQVYSNNNVNYDIWLDPDTSFWSPTDFLLEAEFFETPMDEPNTIIDEKLDVLTQKVEALNTTVTKLAGAIKSLIQYGRPKQE